ncbi:putative E3 ubiquitin ligase [Handroanthus impetiginosus]|uniref:RBR-type E3 ubiquitin transferase n=1 Tax=Handroanthus impetiginosus TaxID=429701 RepID=A0A2G9HEX9_9LAMI|nr:putative E3 ubiquitin ligase [Handroanthus impetiginosus]
MGDDSGYGNCDDEFYNGAYDDNDEGFEEPDSDGESCGSIGEAFSCKVIRKESLLAAQKNDLQRVMDLLSLKEHHARTLLIHYRWDVDKVFTVFVEKGVEQLYKEAGVSVVESEYLSSSHVSSNISCEICYEDVSANETTTMDCGHCFCNECWTKHFIVKINDGQSRRITCMADKCYSICDEGKIRNLVSVRDPQLAEKFDNFLLESYIEDNERVKWCPSVPHCGNAIRIENDKYCEVECACGLQFCFNCLSEAHSPCSCVMWELWLKKQEKESESVDWIKKESESVDWIMKNVKSCPKCHKPVEKNGGCNLVQCVCGQPFCWLCGNATGLEHTWTRIANHECGRYKDEHGQEIERARKELWRYTHYYNRYQAHTESLKAEENMKEKLHQKVAALESREFKTKDYIWVLSGHYRLTRARQILLYSYPFAYFMFGDELFKNEMSSEENTIKQNLFEDQQQQLETNIERLSMLLEEPFDKFDEDKLSETRMKIINLSAVTDNLCKKLSNCIESELLGPLQQATHIIAPYRSNGVEKASEL